jgi:hypothetical protein
LVIVPKQIQTIKNGTKLIEQLGRQFQIDGEETQALIYIGTEYLLTNFVIPNVGTEY